MKKSKAKIFWLKWESILTKKGNIKIKKGFEKLVKRVKISTEDKTQRITSYVTGTGLKVYEVEQYNKDCNDWFIVGDYSENEQYIKNSVWLHNYKLIKS